MKIGQTVYTVNAKTNEVDSWEFAGTIKDDGEILVRLENGDKSCFLPARCVYETETVAKYIAGLKD